MDAQAGLRLCCLQTPEDRFSCVEAHIIENSVDPDQLASGQLIRTHTVFKTGDITVLRFSILRVNYFFLFLNKCICFGYSKETS